MKKKFALLLAAALMLQAAPVLADNHDGNGHKGKMFERSDINGDGVISRDEAQVRFDKMDADRDGSVSREESRNAMEKWKKKRKEMREKRRDTIDGQE